MLDFLRNFMLSFDAPDGAGGGGTPDIRAAVTDLGGVAPAGEEPDIFDDAPSADDAPADDAPADDEPPADDDEPPADEPPADGDEPPADDEPKDDEPPKDDDAPKDDADKTPEEKAAEAKAAAERAKKPLTEEEKQIEATLQEAYRSNPALKAALKAYPQLRGEFFRAASINKLYPGGIKEATQAKEYALELFKIDNLYYGTSPQSKRELVNFLWNENLDAKGQSTGHFEQLAEIMVTDTLGGVEKALTQNPTLAAQVAANFTPAQAATSIEVVRRLMSILSGKPIGKGEATDRIPKADLEKLGVTNESDMTPRERRLAQELSQERARNQEADRTSSAQREQQFNLSVYNEFDKGLKSDLDRRIPASIQSNSRLVQWFGREVREEIQKALEADSYFVAQLEAASRSGDRGPQHIAELAGMMEQRAKLLLPAIARKVSDEFALRPKAPVNPNDRNDRRQDNKRVDRTRTAPRREPALNGNPGRLSKPVEGRRAAPARSSGVQKTSGDYNRDADKLLGID
jgi:hypothetical protein